MNLTFLGISHEWNRTEFFLWWLTDFTQYNFKVHPMCQDVSFLFKANAIPLYLYTTLVCPFRARAFLKKLFIGNFTHTQSRENSVGFPLNWSCTNYQHFRQNLKELAPLLYSPIWPFTCGSCDSDSSGLTSSGPLRKVPCEEPQNLELRNASSPDKICLSFLSSRYAWA